MKTPKPPVPKVKSKPYPIKGKGTPKPRTYTIEEVQRLMGFALSAATNSAVSVINKSPIAGSDIATYIKERLQAEVSNGIEFLENKEPTSPRVDCSNPSIIVDVEDKVVSLPASAFFHEVSNGYGHCTVCGQMGSFKLPFGVSGSIKHETTCVVGNAIHAAYEKMSGHSIPKG